ncbi:MAG: branched chain amino acid aminotransferase, partial [Eggerthellaceae bacterium]|nr:branched chain amino acid aminotransferase [Eggerthellaceae bacterium]
KYLGLKVEQRPVKFAEIDQFVECGMCGTAAVISPVGHIQAKGVDVTFPDGSETSGPVMAKLRKTLTDIQAGKIEGPEGWVVKIC